MLIRSNSSNSNRNTNTKNLPNWIFDVDSEDEYDNNNVSLLEELDIDLIHIYNNIGWTLSTPLYYILRKPMDSIHPLQSSHTSSSSSKGHIDFW